MDQETFMSFQVEPHKCEHNFLLGDIIRYSSDDSNCPVCQSTFPIRNIKTMYIGDTQQGILIAHILKLMDLVICPNCGKVSTHISMLCTPAQIVTIRR